MIKYVLIVVSASFIIGCNSSKRLSSLIINPVLSMEEASDVQQEIDDIYALLIYALVYADWQPDSIPRRLRRGYNIGALIVNKDNLPVHYELNCINSTDNSTQHGEVRAIMSYLEQNKLFDLSGFSIYTTLEPCIMCAGMMTMTSVKRVVYGQRDVDYSKAFERLALDTRPIGGFAPYPRRVMAQASNIIYCQELDREYQAFLKEDDEKVLAKFLASEAARQIYEKASNAFLSFNVKYEVNQPIYQAALAFYKSR